MQDVVTILLLGGEGKRMCSATPKPLHMLCGRPMLDWVLGAVPAGGGMPVALVNAGADKIKAHYGETLRYVQSGISRGTGGALCAAREYLNAKRALVLAGDLPMLRQETLNRLTQLDAGAVFLCAALADPTGYGRVLRADGKVIKIIEADEVTAATNYLREARVSAYCFDVPMLLRALCELESENPLDEIAMRDIVGWFINSGESVDVLPIPPEEAMGVNDRVQLAACAAALRARVNHRHMLHGVTFIDPASTYIDDTVKLGRDCTVYPGVVLEGNTVIGEGTTLYPACRLTDSVVGLFCALQGVVAHSAVVGDNVTAGPYVHLRPGARIGNLCKIGNYIEVKNSSVGEGTKLPHLSYIGDSDLGSRVNVGCGSVTVNYDGVKKHRTVIGDDAFIGCHTSLVAPVRVGDKAFTAAGSVITEDVPEDTLAIARARQVNKLGYAKKLRKKN